MHQQLIKPTHSPVTPKQQRCAELLQFMTAVVWAGLPLPAKPGRRSRPSTAAPQAPVEAFTAQPPEQPSSKRRRSAKAGSADAVARPAGRRSKQPSMSEEQRNSAVSIIEARSLLLAVLCWSFLPNRPELLKFLACVQRVAMCCISTSKCRCQLRCHAALPAKILHA